MLDYPGRHHPDSRGFRRLEHCLLKTGNIISFALVVVGHPQTLRTPDNEDAVKHSRRDAVMPQHEN